MRVLMITHPLPTLDHPGTMAPVARLIDSLRKIGVQVDVLEIKGIPKLKYLQALPAQRALTPLVDIIHAHFGYCGWLGYLQLSKPLVVSFMGSDLLGDPDVNGRVHSFSKLVIKANRWLACKVDAVIVKSAEMAKIVAPVKAHVVPNGADLELFKPMDQAEARAALGWAKGKHYILFPGNPELPRKSFHLAQAAVMAAAKFMIETLELIPLWKVAPDRVPVYMNACDALLMTSYIEGSPNVVKEAMACNLPVVSVPVGDVPEMLKGVHGCTICPYGAEPLGNALVSILTNGRRINGRAALKDRRLDLESVARRITKIYAKVLERKIKRGHCSSLFGFKTERDHTFEARYLRMQCGDGTCSIWIIWRNYSINMKLALPIMEHLFCSLLKVELWYRLFIDVQPPATLAASSVITVDPVEIGLVGDQQ